ncbi:MAG: Rrf2 family transcriptional regulator [Candidatus Latescibacterota bacterium]|nr:MAG: Rrf2 family transcriptional regulator [Candidatus Latescibacterota bacterium]
MAVLFSPSAQQALRALIFLARRADAAPVLVRDIADAEQIPRPFLSKLLHSLRNRGIVKSTKGPGGGYALALPSDRVRVSDIVETFDGSVDLSKTCVLGLDECADASACALHEQWKLFRERYAGTIASLTLREVATTIERKRRGRKRSPAKARTAKRR